MSLKGRVTGTKNRREKVGHANGAHTHIPPRASPAVYLAKSYPSHNIKLPTHTNALFVFVLLIALIVIYSVQNILYVWPICKLIKIVLIG